MLVRVAVQRVDEGHAFRRDDRLARRERGQRAKDLVVAQAEDLAQVEPKQGLAPPLCALDDEELVVPYEQQPARRMCVAKHDLGGGRFPVGVEQRD